MLLGNELRTSARSNNAFTFAVSLIEDIPHIEPRSANIPFSSALGRSTANNGFSLVKFSIFFWVESAPALAVVSVAFLELDNPANALLFCVVSVLLLSTSVEVEPDPFAFARMVFASDKYLNASGLVNVS